MILLLKLIAAHLIGDFFLQPRTWVEEKEREKLRSPKLYIHILIHLALLFLFVWDLSKWPLILIIGGSHFIIDALKLTLQKKKTKRFFLFIDQFLHILVILLAFWWFTNTKISFETIFTFELLLLIICLLSLTRPTSIIMQTIISKWNIEKLTKDNQSLKDAGKYIGILERLLVFTFIVVGHWEAVGFLITAKSVFRFGDLKESKHRKLTEYILIGTLISFGIAIAIALLYMHLA